MARLIQIKIEKNVDRQFLPALLEKGMGKALKEKERSKVAMFEDGLSSGLSSSDTIEGSVEKIVKMALAAEFGPSLLTKTGAKGMISTISRGILSDSELRRSALIIADRFSSSKVGKAVKLRGKRKAVLNG